VPRPVPRYESNLDIISTSRVCACSDPKAPDSLFPLAARVFKRTFKYLQSPRAPLLGLKSLSLSLSLSLFLFGFRQEQSTLWRYNTNNRCQFTPRPASPLFRQPAACIDPDMSNLHTRVLCRALPAARARGIFHFVLSANE